MSDITIDTLQHLANKLDALVSIVSSDYVSIEEAAKIMRVSRRTIHNKIKLGIIKRDPVSCALQSNFIHSHLCGFIYVCSYGESTCLAI